MQGTQCVAMEGKGTSCIRQKARGLDQVDLYVWEWNYRMHLSMNKLLTRRMTSAVDRKYSSTCTVKSVDYLYNVKNLSC